jgi:eukaryotic-like serine/threonine-protein kinase
MRTLLAGRLRLVDLVGEGGSGTVWRAWDAHLRTFVAAKVVLRAAVDGHLPSCPQHPHLVVPTERLIDGHRRVSLMRLVRGGTADRLLGEHGTLPQDFVAVLLDHLLHALAVLHDSGLVHRDVKPANLLLEPTGTGRPHLRLADLDVAVPIGETSPEVAGTDGYIAPEARRGAPADVRHDLYAAGVTAGELLTGRVPLHPDDLPRGPLHQVVRELLETETTRRTSSAHEALRVLHETGIPSGAPWQARPHPPEVPDRLGRLPLSLRWRYGVRAAQ